jgi:penicillin amidase
MYRKNWGIFCVIALMLMALSGCSSSDEECPLSVETKTTVDVTRDAKGVWFISGTKDATYYNIFEAMGYAVATDRLWQAEKYRRTARGRLAEIFGSSQLQTDIFMRTMGYSDQELQAGFDALDKETQSVIQAYVAGFNRRIAEIRKDKSLLPYEFAAIGAKAGIEFIPEDWSVSDVLAWEALMLRNFDPEGYENQEQLNNAKLYAMLYLKSPNNVQAMFDDLRWTNDPEALTYISFKTRAAQSKIQEYESLPAVDDISEAADAIIGTRKAVTENLKEINAYVKMGSYAWTVSGKKTATGNPILYSGPQMGFFVPSIVMEGSVRAADLNISGMSIPGIPGIVVGRTPHHAWSMQVGHGHSADYYIESADAVKLHRTETIKVAGAASVQLPVYRSSHGPIINPMPYDPSTYIPTILNPIVSWKYAHRGYEFQTIKAYLDIARAQNMDDFGKAIENVGVSQHFCYADKDGNIAYWMSGRDPLRAAADYRFPQGVLSGAAVMEWDAAVLKPRSTDRNTTRGFYGGWNNKTSGNYANSSNNPSYFFGPFHRAHVIDEYLSSHDKLTYEQLRDLALDIAATDSFGLGGNPWQFVSKYFSDAVRANPVSSGYDCISLLSLLENWDGHFVSGGASQWASGKDRADGWMLADAWIREAIRLTFEDELGDYYKDQNMTVLFNVMLHGLKGASSEITNKYNWFQNLSDPKAPQTANEIIVTALDNAVVKLGAAPWGKDKRGTIEYKHELIGTVHTMPFTSRSTYGQCVEVGTAGPVRIQSMFPLGESGNITMGADGKPVFDKNFFSMTTEFDNFTPREFPLFQ